MVTVYLVILAVSMGRNLMSKSVPPAISRVLA